jgi:hypothetical protein
MYLDNLCQFERRTRELKAQGRIEEVIRLLKGDGQDNRLMERLNEVFTNITTLQRLERLWNDEQLTELQELKQSAIDRIQEGIITGLKEPNIYELVDCSDMAGTVGLDEAYQNLRRYAFICIRQIREGNSSRRKDWEGIYREIETIQDLLRPAPDYVGYPEEKEWLDWMNRNAPRQNEDTTRYPHSERPSFARLQSWLDTLIAKSSDEEKSTEEKSTEEKIKRKLLRLYDSDRVCIAQYLF